MPHSFCNAAKALAIFAIHFARHALQLGYDALLLHRNSVVVGSFAGRFRSYAENLSGFPLTLRVFTGFYARRVGVDASDLSGFPPTLRAFSLLFSVHLKIIARHTEQVLSFFQ